MAEEWDAFAEGRAPPGHGVAGWSRLETVRHGTHLEAAVRIAEDGLLESRLIYDGKLQATRTKVVYFSPNTWGNGSRYGSFEFEVEWPTLVAQGQLYWVEAIRTYKLPIYRFLISSRDVSALHLRPYDPDTGSGPIRRVGSDWFWASGDAVAEIVRDDDMSLTDVSRLGFEKHHDTYCSMRRANCREAGYSGQSRVVAALLGLLLGRGLHSLDDMLRLGGEPSNWVRYGLSHLYTHLGGHSDLAGTVADDETASDLIRAACLLLHAGDRRRARRFVAMIDTKERLLRLLIDLVREHFNAPGFAWD